jgi:hypothetical protein
LFAPGQVKLMAPELQYLDGVNPLLDLTHQLSHDPTPPPVISVSHASSKAGFDSIPLEGFDIDAALLSLQVGTPCAMHISPSAPTPSSPLRPIPTAKGPNV